MMQLNLLIVFSFNVQKALVSPRVSYLLQHLLLFFLLVISLLCTNSFSFSLCSPIVPAKIKIYTHK